MSLSEAIATELRRYVEACREHSARKAHIHHLALRRLSHYEVTEREALIVATPEIHARGAIAA